MIDICEPTIEPPSNGGIEFVNRDRELKEITKPGAAPYLLISAPAEYGKSRLLQQVLAHWSQQCFCIDLCLVGERNLELAELARRILSQCPGSSADATSADTVGLSLLKAAHQASKGALLLAIDGVEAIAAGAIAELMNNFIPNLSKLLNNRPSIPLDFRVILAGRHPTPWRQTPAGILLKEVKLTPFDFEAVHQTVRKFKVPDMPNFSCEYVQRYAQHLMWFTGGHPGAMAKILTNGDFGRPIGSHEEIYYQKIVRPLITQIRDEQIPPDMRAIFDILSPMRRCDLNLLDHFIQFDLIHWPRRPIVLEDALIKTGLFVPVDGFTSNASTRRLLAIRLRREQSEHFKRSCDEAIKFFRDQLRALAYRPELCALEILFLELQLLSLAPHRQPDELIDTMQVIVTYLGNAPAGKQLMAAFGQYLRDDWELEFIWRYLFPDHPPERWLEKILSHEPSDQTKER